MKIHFIRIVNTYVIFFSQLEVENPEASFDHINDVWLEAYAYQILERNQNSPVYISQILTTVIHF